MTLKNSYTEAEIAQIREENKIYAARSKKFIDDQLGRLNKPSRNTHEYAVLLDLFGSAIKDIKKVFLTLDANAIDGLMSEYGLIYGDTAERYARETYGHWQSGSIRLSGKTISRLIKLIPPRLGPQQRYEILLKVLKQHEIARKRPKIPVKINLQNPSEGFRQIDRMLEDSEPDDLLALIPEAVIEAAKWLSDDDITAARAMLAEIKKTEANLLKDKAIKEVGLLKRAISEGQIKSASQSVETPNCTLSVVAYTPAKCFVATVCFGIDSYETKVLKAWRDDYLIHSPIGRHFIVWYYSHGDSIARIVQRFAPLKLVSQIFVGVIARLVKY
jgi:hypothetical protein